MKKLVLMFLLGLLIASAAMAAVPNQMNVQGRLLDAGDPISGPHPAIFTIYDAATGGNLLWTESSSLDVQSGIFTAILGSTTPIPTIVFNSQPRWLEVTVDGSILNPRLPLTTNAYAFWSQRSDTATVALNSLMAGGQWETNGTDVWRTGGYVGVGTSSPNHPIEAHNPLPGQVGYFHSTSTSGTNYGMDAGAQGVGAETNIGGYFYASGATNNYAIIVPPDYGKVGIGTNNPDAQLDVRGVSEVTDDNTSPDTRLYATFGVTRAAVGSNQSYIGLTKQATIPWAMGINGGDGFIIGVPLPNKTIPEPILTLLKYPSPAVYVNGNFTATGTKCREVDTAKYGKLYYSAVESANALFSLEGQGTMQDGVAHVELDQKWLAGVTIDEQHPMQVWITFYGPHGDYYVDRTNNHNGFKVVDPSGSNSAFGWKVEARQRGYEDLYLNQPTTLTAK